MAGTQDTSDSCHLLNLDTLDTLEKQNDWVQREEVEFGGGVEEAMGGLVIGGEEKVVESAARSLEGLVLGGREVVGRGGRSSLGRGGFGVREKEGVVGRRCHRCGLLTGLKSHSSRCGRRKERGRVVSSLSSLSSSSLSSTTLDSLYSTLSSGRWRFCLSCK